MAKTITGYAPFAYDNDYYVYTDSEDAKKLAFQSFYTQRNAKYKKAAEEVYNYLNVSEGELALEAFRGTIFAPTPRILEVDGYDAEESEEEGGGESGGGDEPVNPDEPTDPENPDEPTNPDEPQEPENPDEPQEPENPDTPTEP